MPAEPEEPNLVESEDSQESTQIRDDAIALGTEAIKRTFPEIMDDSEIARQLDEPDDTWEDTGGGNRRKGKIEDLSSSLQVALETVMPYVDETKLDSERTVPALTRVLKEIQEVALAGKQPLSDFVAQEIKEFKDRYDAGKGDVKTYAATWHKDVGFLINAIQRLHNTNEEIIADYQADRPSRIWADHQATKAMIDAVGFGYEIILTVTRQDTAHPGEDRAEHASKDKEKVIEWLEGYQDEIAEKGGIASKPNPRTNQSAMTRRENKIKDARRRT